MQIKNLNFVEKHIEKVAIGVGLVFFALIMWLYVVGQPYTIQLVGSTQRVTPDKVEVMIREQATKLDRQIHLKTLPFKKIPLPSWTHDFRDRMAGHFLPVDKLPYPLSYPGLDEKLVVVEYVPNPKLAVPTPPEAKDVLAQADYGVLAPPVDDASRDQLVKLVGQIGSPADFRYVSVAATYSMQDWRKLLQAPNESQEQRIPEDWWRNRLYITDVVLERQELDTATGKWSKPMVIASPPTQQHPYRNVTTKFTAGEVPSLLDNIRQSQDMITQPAFVPMAKGVWRMPGSTAQLSEAQAQELLDIQQQLAKSKHRLLAIQTAGGSGSTAAPIRTQIGPDGPGSTGRGRTATNAPTTLQGQITELETRRDILLGIARATPNESNADQNPDDQMQDQLARGSRRFGRGGQRGRTQETNRNGSGFQGQDRSNGMAVIPPLSDLKIWAHDLTVKPGETYRYRMVVSVLDPLFHSNEVSREQYKEYFNKLALVSSPSAWSAPVQVDPKVYFFLTGLDAARQQATVDVFHIFDGVWVRKPFQVKAGDPIGTAVTLPYQDQAQEVDMDTHALVVDIQFPVSQLGMSSNARNTRMIVYQPKTGDMSSRTVDKDTKSPTYERILREIQIRSVMTNSH